jgi:hypothetical protein
MWGNLLFSNKISPKSQIAISNFEKEMKKKKVKITIFIYLFLNE